MNIVPLTVVGHHKCFARYGRPSSNQSNSNCHKNAGQPNVMVGPGGGYDSMGPHAGVVSRIE